MSKTTIVTISLTILSIVLSGSALILNYGLTGYVYKFFSSGLWSSFGAILSMIGVFLGAWFGAKFGYNQNVKLKNEELKENKDTHLIFLRDELQQNRTLVNMHDFKSEYKTNLEITHEFAMLELIAGSIKKDYFTAIAKSNILPILDK